MTVDGMEVNKEKTKESEEFDKIVGLQATPRKFEIIYFNILTFSYWYLAGAYGFYLCFTSAKWSSILFAVITVTIAQFGVTAGAHRLWSHKAYKATLPLEVILMLWNSIAFQNTVFDWVRNHRLHHKYSDTDADPHNATRGFFYSHLGWLITRKHPEVKKRGKLIDMSDIYNNSVLKFQKKYAIPLIGMLCFVLPTIIPMYFWGETLNNAWHLNIMRYLANLNMSFSINSAAHKFGYKPYDKSILPTQSVSLAVFTLGEGYHNYHHVFPWDYRTSEFGNTKYNLTSMLIDLCAWLGLAYDLKEASKEMIKTRSERTGDGTDLWGEKKLK